MLRDLEIPKNSGNRWRGQYGGMKTNEVKRLRELESENARLQDLLARRNSTSRCSKSWPRRTSALERRRAPV